MATASAKDGWGNAAREYQHNPRFSDFTILCQGIEFKVHRCFVTVHSKWFDKCCSGAFAEATKRKVELVGDKVQAVKAMINFFYTLDYDDSDDNDDCAEAVDDYNVNPDHEAPNSRARSLALNAWVYATADKYDVPKLKALALDKFVKAIRESDASLISMASTVKTVYCRINFSASDETLHDWLLWDWMYNVPRIYETDDEGDALYQWLLEEVPDFLLCILKRFTKDAAEKKATQKRAAEKRAAAKKAAALKSALEDTEAEVS